jgi:hypothetical protein
MIEEAVVNRSEVRELKNNYVFKTVWLSRKLRGTLSVFITIL